MSELIGTTNFGSVAVLINALILWLMAMWGFKVPFKGDPLAFLLGTAVYVVMLPPSVWSSRSSSGASRPR